MNRKILDWKLRLEMLFPFGAAFLVTLFAAVALVQFDGLRHQHLLLAERSQVQKELDLVRAHLENEITLPLLETQFVAAQIAARGDISRDDFLREATILTAGQKSVRNLIITRGTVIAYAYPNVGNPSMIGFDFRSSALKWASVEKAMRTHQPVLSGPEPLLQGGNGLALRIPVYRQNAATHQEEFTGLVGLVLDMDAIFAGVQLDSKDQPVKYVVCAGGENAPFQVLHGDADIWDHDPVYLDVSFPYGTWHIAAIPKSGWSSNERLYTPARLISLLMFFTVSLTSFSTAFFFVQRARAQRRLILSQRHARREASRFHALMEQASDGIHILDREGRLIDASNSFCQMLGYCLNELSGKTPHFWDVGFSEEKINSVINEILYRDGVVCHETRHRRRDGTEFDVEVTGCRMSIDGEIMLFYSARDITERRNAERQIYQLAYYDQLTGLPNRTLLTDRIRTAMAGSERSGKPGALLFIDLDNFKILNDTLGHAMGDLLLQQVAARLLLCVRGEDTVARLGGDEFLVMTPHLGRNEEIAAFEAEALAERIRKTLSENYQLQTVSYRCTPSIGITLFRGHQSSYNDLLKQADMAMYRAKEAGRNSISFFDPGMEKAVHERASLEADLREAIDKEHFALYFQVQMDGLHHPVGAECLIRWKHPQRGMVSPADFIPLAEETSLILPLGQWVLRTACRRLAAWSLQPGMEHLTLAVNVSIRQFRQADFVEKVLAAIHEARANPCLLKLELTESLLVEDVEETIEKMVALKSVGVSFSLDDFGTGYSSLAYLRRLPLDQLKIDQSFVRDALIDPNDAALARTVIALGQSLALGVIAEGVETQGQMDFLLSSGCNFFQGYLFGRPVPIEDFEREVGGRRESQ